MEFTPLHRALGYAPRPLTDELLDAAINAGVRETDDLDWKSELPPIKGLPQSDVSKDIAAMANAGGGMIIYGVEESQKAATGRKDTGEFTEGHERAYRSAAVSAISPPVFGLDIYRLGTDSRAVAVVIPASVDGPHISSIGMTISVRPYAMMQIPFGCENDRLKPCTGRDSTSVDDLPKPSILSMMRQPRGATRISAHGSSQLPARAFLRFWPVLIEMKREQSSNALRI